MTDDTGLKQDPLARELEDIERSIPEIPKTYQTLRGLLGSLPSPTLPDLREARRGAAQPAATASLGSGGAQSPLSGPGPGQDSGGAIGVLPQLYYGKVNQLLDPMMRNVGTNTIGGAFAGEGEWDCQRVVNAGGAPATTEFDGAATTVVDSNSPLNTDVASITLGGFVAGDVTYLIRSAQSYFQPVGAPYILSSVRLARILGFTNTFTNVTSAIATIEIVDAVTGTVVATSTPFDWKAWIQSSDDGSEVRLTAPYLNPGTGADVYWQLRLRVVATGAGGSLNFLFGEPQLVAAATELPPPFSPIIGSWVPEEVERRSFTSTEVVIAARTTVDTQERVRILTTGAIDWGSGTAARDLRIQRSAASVLRLDDNAGGRASAELREGTGPGAAAAGFGRLYFSSATKTFHQVDDAGVDTDLGAVTALLATRDEGVALGATSVMDFVGAGVTATFLAGVTTVTIPGGGVATQVSRDAAAAAADYVARIRLTTDTTYRAFLGLTAADVGSLEFGPGGVAARDVRISRGASGQTKIDSGGAAVTTSVMVEATAGQLVGVDLQVAGDANSRFALRGDATLVGWEMGGGGARDIQVRRLSAGTVVFSANGGASQTSVAAESTVGQRSSFAAFVAGDAASRAVLFGDATRVGLELGPGSGARDLYLYRAGAGELRLDGVVAGTNNAVLRITSGSAPGATDYTAFLVNRSGDAAARAVFGYMGDVSATGIAFGPGSAGRDWYLIRSAADTASLASGDVLDTGSGHFIAPAGAGGPSVLNDGSLRLDTTDIRFMVYDGQRNRDVSAAGFAPYAYPISWEPSLAFTTAQALAGSGGTIAIPIVVTTHMLIQSVSYRAQAAGGATEFRLYRQRLNAGNASENTLNFVSGTNGTAAAPGAAATLTNNIATPGTYIGPGVYWLVIRTTTATAFQLGSTAASAAFAVNTAQTKTIGVALGATLDFVAAVWTKVTAIYAVRLNGRVFGQTAAF